MSLDHVVIDGKQFKLGNNPAPVRLKWTPFGADDKTRLIPRSEWPALIDAYAAGPGLETLTYVHDQNGYGMCNASATVSAMETAALRQGYPLVKLSAGDLYNRISGGSDNGSTLEDGLEESQNGIAEVSECPYLEWRRRSAGVTRKNHKVLEYYIAPTFDHCMSGVFQGFDLISGVMWYDNFNPNADGWCPDRGRGSGGGHAVHGYKPARMGTKYGIWHKNSWTERWGLNGHGIFPETWYGGAVGGWWLVRVTTAYDAEKIPAPVFGV